MSFRCSLVVASAFISALLSFIAGTAVAADQYVVAVGATTEVNEHGECRMVTNPSSAPHARFISTKTASEWQNFRDNPNGLEMAACAAGGGGCGNDGLGTEVGGYCWYAGIAGEFCTQVCASRGGVNMAGTRDYAGSGGTLENCQAVVAALWGITFTDTQNEPLGTNDYGCSSYFGWLGARVHYAPTTANSSYHTAARACACN